MCTRGDCIIIASEHKGREGEGEKGTCSQGQVNCTDPLVVLRRTPQDRSPADGWFAELPNRKGKLNLHNLFPLVDT